MTAGRDDVFKAICTAADRGEPLTFRDILAFDPAVVRGLIEADRIVEGRMRVGSAEIVVMLPAPPLPEDEEAWSTDEDEYLGIAYTVGVTFASMTAALRRTGGEILQRAWKLGLDRPQADRGRRHRAHRDDWTGAEIPAWRFARLRGLVEEAEMRGANPRDDGEGLEHRALARRFAASRAAHAAEGHKGMPWTPADDAELLRLRDLGSGVAAIATALLLAGGAVDRGNTPPGAPNDGEVYLVTGSPTGAWGSNANQLALYLNGGWVFFTPATDFVIWVADEDRFYKFTGAAWAAALGSLAYDDYNLDSAVGIVAGTVSAPGLYVVGDTNTGLYQPSGGDSLGVAIGGARRAQFDSEGLIVGDDTPSADVTLGLVINQGAADNAATAWKSSDVVHNLTSIVEADSFGTAGKVDGAAGGLLLQGFSESTGTLAGAAIVGHVDAADATKGTGGVAIVEAHAWIDDAAGGRTAPGGSANLFGVYAGAGATHLFDSDGDVWINGQFQPGNGTVGAPSYGFVNDIDSGMYLVGAGIVALATAGVDALRLTDTQQIVAGYTSALVLGATTPKMQVHAAANAAIGAVRWSATADAPGQLTLGKSKSATVGTFGTVASGDTVGAVVFVADDGADLVTQAGAIKVVVNGAVSGSTVPAYMAFYTAAGGSADDIAEKMRLTKNGSLFLNATSNANMTAGLTINQGTAADEALALKSTSLSHTLTTIMEANTYLTFGKINGSTGGVLINSVRASGKPAYEMRGYTTSYDTAPGTSATGTFHFRAGNFSGTSNANVPADALLFSVAARRNSAFETVWFIDEDGDTHADAVHNDNAFDDHDDVALLDSFRTLQFTDRDAARRFFSGWAQEHVAVLERAGIVTVTPRPDGREDIFYSRKGLEALMIDAIRQLAQRIGAVESRVALPAPH